MESTEAGWARTLFSETNEYTENYEKISSDHISSIQGGITNQFITEDLWIEMETPTIELIKKYSQAGDKILDVGVGLGRLLSHVPSLEKYGMDISFGYLNQARQNGINVCYSLVEDMPYKQEAFDIVVCTDVLEHVLELNLSCAKILSVLKTGGILIVRVPFREDLSNYLSPTYPYKYAHLRNFDENSLSLLFERIFECEVVEMVTAAYATAGKKLKYSLPLPKFASIMEIILLSIKSISDSFYKSIISRLYYPIEINIVVKKK